MLPQRVPGEHLSEPSSSFRMAEGTCDPWRGLASLPSLPCGHLFLFLCLCLPSSSWKDTSLWVTVDLSLVTSAKAYSQMRLCSQPLVAREHDPASSITQTCYSPEETGWSCSPARPVAVAGGGLTEMGTSTQDEWGFCKCRRNEFKDTSSGGIAKLCWGSRYLGGRMWAVST